MKPTLHSFPCLNLSIIFSTNCALKKAHCPLLQRKQNIISEIKKKALDQKHSMEINKPVFSTNFL